MGKLWPRDVDPGRKLLVFIPRKGKPPMLVHPDEGEDLAWVLVSETYFEGHHVARFEERDVEDIQGMFWRHVGLEGGEGRRDGGT